MVSRGLKFPFENFDNRPWRETLQRDLLNEALLERFSYYPGSDLMAVMKPCKRFRQLLKEHERYGNPRKLSKQTYLLMLLASDMLPALETCL
jgi:hypothetical protein